MKFNCILAAIAFTATAKADQQQQPPTDYSHAPMSHAHSIEPPFTHSHFENEYWDFGGSTMVRIYDYVRLTGDFESQAGYMWTKEPFHARSWMIEIAFRIHGENPTIFGDGLAFWYSTSKFEPGYAFGYKPDFKGLGVFFDTFPNARHQHTFPYISAMIGDGKIVYDHMNDNKNTIAGHGCEANIRGTANPVVARITYFKNQVLKLEFTESDANHWQTCFVLSNVSLPDGGYIGLTAATGAVHDNHDVHRVMTRLHLQDEIYHGTKMFNSAIHNDEYEEEDEHGPLAVFANFLAFIVKLALFCLVIGGAYFGYRTFASKNMKRF